MKKSELLKVLYVRAENFLAAGGAPLDLVEVVLDAALELGMAPPEAQIAIKRELSSGLDVTCFKKERTWEAELK